MTNLQTQKILKWAQAVAYVLGSILVVYNLSAVRVAKVGYYFVDKNKLWLSIGVGLYAVGIVIKNWNRP